MGRKKISRIDNDRTRGITFNKRKSGLIKKAMELSILCECEISVVIFNKENERMTNLYEYSSSDPRQILQKYCSVAALPHERYANKDYELFCRKRKGGPRVKPENKKSSSNTTKKRSTRNTRSRRGKKKNEEDKEKEIQPKILEIVMKEDEIKNSTPARAPPLPNQPPQFHFDVQNHMPSPNQGGSGGGMQNYYYPPGSGSYPNQQMQPPQQRQMHQGGMMSGNTNHVNLHMMPAKKRLNQSYYQDSMNPYSQAPRSIDSSGSLGENRQEFSQNVHLPPPPGNVSFVTMTPNQLSPPNSSDSTRKRKRILPSITNALSPDNDEDGNPSKTQIHPLQSQPLNMKGGGGGGNGMDSKMSLGSFPAMNASPFSPMMLPTTPKTFDLDTPGIISEFPPSLGPNTYQSPPNSDEK